MTAAKLPPLPRDAPGWHGPWHKGAMRDRRQARREAAADRAERAAGRRRRQAGDTT